MVVITVRITGHLLVVVVIAVRITVWDHLCFVTMVAVDAFGRHRATHELA